MRGLRFPMVIVFLLIVVAFPVRLCNADEYQRINQGDWAVALVRGLRLDLGRQPNKIDDFTILLSGVGIKPKEGWQADYALSFEDYAGTINQALQYLNSHKSEEYSVYDEFLGFLENKVGIRMTTLLDGLKNDLELELRTPISEYLKNKAAEEENAGVVTDKKAQMVNSNIKEFDLWDALFIGESIKSDNYWKIFNRPSSPILPGKFY